jgi:hypothetical protein
MGTGSIPPVGPLAYEGVVAPQYITRTFSPTPQFDNFPISTVWINTQSKSAYILVNKALGIATWLPLGCSCSIGIQTITTPDSVVVTPISANINFLESGNIAITGSGNNVSFDVTGGGLVWNEIFIPSATLSADTGYIINTATLANLFLPVAIPQGSLISIVGKGVGGWKISQQPGQRMFNGSATTSFGIGGFLSSTFMRDCVELLCITANTEFQVLNEVGNITYV